MKNTVEGKPNVTPQSTFPKPPPPGAHEASADALQRWLWQCLAAGWNPLGGTDPVWSHDDNMAVQHLGWMIAKPPNSPFYELFSLHSHVHPSSIMKKIVSAAPIDPICAKAVAILGAQRLTHPQIKFAYAES